MNDNQLPKLRFLHETPESRIAEGYQRGYLSHTLVELPDGKMCAVFFYDTVRLQQDLEENTKRGEPFIAEVGMIVVEEITLTNLVTAVNRLYTEGFFSYMVPITQEQLDTANPFAWPP
jgi:hypothetical protein